MPTMPTMPLMMLDLTRLHRGEHFFFGEPSLVSACIAIASQRVRLLLPLVVVFESSLIEIVIRRDSWYDTVAMPHTCLIADAARKLSRNFSIFFINFPENSLNWIWSVRHRWRSIKFCKISFGVIWDSTWEWNISRFEMLNCREHLSQRILPLIRDSLMYGMYARCFIQRTWYVHVINYKVITSRWHE